ncbi:MAG: hypothetical protein ACE5F1_05905 [Planctomycetota bacterium]
MTPTDPARDPARRPPAPLLLLPLICSSLCSCSSTPPGKAAEPPVAVEAARKALEEAQRAQLSGDPEAALNRLDRIHRSGLPLRLRGKILLLAGEANFALARQGMESRVRGNSSMVEGCFLDAEESLLHAIQDLPDSPRPALLLAEVRQARGDPAGCVEAATTVLARLRELQRPPEQYVPALMLRGKARLRQLIDLRQKEIAATPETREKPTDAALRQAQTALLDFAAALKLDPGLADAYIQGSLTHSWVNRPSDALEVLEEGVRRNPADFALHSRLRSQYLSLSRPLELHGFYSRLSKELGDSAEVLWSLAIAKICKADDERRRGERKAADASYEDAAGTFAHCAEVKPLYGKNCRIQEALCCVARAHLALAGGADARAEELLDRAYEVETEIATLHAEGYDLYRDSFGQSYRAGISDLGGRFKPRSYEQARGFWEKITKRHPAWGWAWNNLGFVCRELGTGASRTGDSGRAMALWEEGYAAYKHAIEVSGDDPRFVNDCALMLVYHLHRDPDRAVELLERAIRLGTEQLEELGEKQEDEDSPARARRQFLEEAVGDAWQNLGVLYRDQQNLAKARSCLKESLNFWSPNNRRSVAGMLERLESQETPQERKDGRN